jgi:hypothetical protein
VFSVSSFLVLNWGILFHAFHVSGISKPVLVVLNVIANITNCFYLRNILDPSMRERGGGEREGRERGREILKSEKEILFSQRCVR